jgi:DNA-binding MarR family transcriptional regulator
MRKVKRFSKKILAEIEDMNCKNYSVKQISKTLGITPTDVKDGIQKIYEAECKEG